MIPTARCGIVPHAGRVARASLEFFCVLSVLMLWASASPLPYKVLISPLREINCVLRHFLLFLLERMQHVQRFLEFRDKEYAMLGTGVDTYLDRAWSHGWHRLPIVWRSTFL
jgi:hypothetical protein